MPTRTTAAALSLALLAVACGPSTAPTEDVGSGDPGEVRIRVGDEITVPGSVLRIGFVAVTEDSRCPVDVTCVWQGNAAIHVGLATGPGAMQPFVLNTARDPTWLDFRGARLTLTGVTPDPHEGSSIPSEEYVATLRVERLADSTP